MPALRRADIPPARLAALNAGTEESRVLVEWLAMDHGALLATVLKTQLQAPPPQSLLAELPALPGPQRMTRIATYLQGLGTPGLREALALHPSDSVRIWSALMAGLEPDLTLLQRIGLLRVVATDPNPGVREYAWMALRPHLAQDVVAGIAALLPLARSEHPWVRRFASEATRPRGVWCAHLRPLRERPELAEDLLEALKADPDRYVQNAVANWLNDASKDRPDWVRALADRWTRQSPGAATAYILKRGLRTLRKNAP